MPRPEDEQAPERKDETPRTDLPPRREPYDEGYFGTEEEEGVAGSREADDEGGDVGSRSSGDGDRSSGKPSPED